MKKYNSVILSVTVDISKYLSSPQYIITYKTGKIRYYLLNDMSYELLQRINNFIDTGLLVHKYKTISVYRYGKQNIDN